MPPVIAASSRNECAGPRILLVEDNAVNRAIMGELLLEAGFDVETAENGAEAVAMAQAVHYDLILMDVHMPVMDGLQATKRIRALSGCRTIPILALTADVFDEDRNRCLRAGMSAQVVKPVDPVTLIGTVERYLPAPDAAQDDAAMRVRIATIPGLNPGKGLRFAAGRLDRYVRRLHTYAHAQASACHALLQACLHGDYDEARNLAHSLSGAAAFVGAEDVHQRAKALESLLRDAAPADEIERAARATHLAETQLLAGIAGLPTETEAMTE